MSGQVLVPAPEVARSLVGPKSSAFVRITVTGCEIFVAASIVLQLILTILNVLARFLSLPLSWPQELAPLPLASVAFIGGAIAYRRGYQLAMTAVQAKLSASWQEIFASASDWIVLGLSGLVTAVSVPLLVKGWHEHTPLLGLPHTFLLAPLTVGMLLFVLQALEFLVRRSRSSVLVGGGAAVSLLLLVLAGELLFSDALTDAYLAGAAFALFALLIAFGIPISFVLTASAAFFLVSGGSGNLVVLPRQMHDSITGFVLLAVPFFILAGFIMTRGGLAKRISDHVNSLVGHRRSGPLQVIILSMYIFSGLSGSKVADIAAVGTTMKSIAKEKGYPPGEIAAVLSASAIMGETIPPSIAMLVLGSITTISIATLFLAGLVPAVFLGLTLSIIATIRSRKADLTIAPKASWSVKRGTFVAAFLPLLLIVILVGGILGGVATPTEVSAIAVVYSAFLTCCFYRELSRPALWEVLIETAVTAGTVLFVISAAAPFAWAMTMAGVPDLIARFVTSGGNSQWMFMLFTIVTLSITGAVLESLPALIIFAPLLLPIAIELGINPVQYGIVLLLSMGIGAFSPPIGVGMYVACLVVETSVAETTRPLLVYLAALIAAVALIAAIPWISLAVPNLFAFS